MSQLLIAMVGLPRSGKSTISKELAKKLGAPIVNRDAIRLSLTGHRYEEDAEPMVKAISGYMIKALFGSGHDIVIYDETNYSIAARDWCRGFGVPVEFYPVMTNPQTCIERAHKTDQPDLEPVIREMYKRYEPLRVWEKVYEAEAV